MEEQTMPEHRESSTRQVFLRDGATIWTATSGTGPQVAWCHGGPGLWDYFAPLAPLVDDSLTSIRFDQRGCGRSTGSGSLTIAQAIDDLDQLRDAFGLTRWAVIGHSWGAELALRYAGVTRSEQPPSSTSPGSVLATVSDPPTSRSETGASARTLTVGLNWVDATERPPRNANGVCCNGALTSHPLPRRSMHRRFGTPDHRESRSPRQQTVNSGPTARTRI